MISRLLGHKVFNKTLLSLLAGTLLLGGGSLRAGEKPPQPPKQIYIPGYMGGAEFTKGFGLILSETDESLARKNIYERNRFRNAQLNEMPAVYDTMIAKAKKILENRTTGPEQEGKYMDYTLFANICVRAISGASPEVMASGLEALLDIAGQLPQGEQRDRIARLGLEQAQLMKEEIKLQQDHQRLMSPESPVQEASARKIRTQMNKPIQAESSRFGKVSMANRIETPQSQIQLKRVEMEAGFLNYFYSLADEARQGANTQTSKEEIANADEFLKNNLTPLVTKIPGQKPISTSQIYPATYAVIGEALAQEIKSLPNTPEGERIRSVQMKAMETLERGSMLRAMQLRDNFYKLGEFKKAEQMDQKAREIASRPVPSILPQQPGLQH